MKCYFCLTAPSTNNEMYLRLLELSIKSAILNTSLSIIILYDGPDKGPCFSLLENYKNLYKNRITIRSHIFSHKRYLKNVYPVQYICNNLGSATDYNKISGAFMRLDIPFIENEDQYVLYTDIDVYFNKDIILENLPKPTYLAASSEFTKSAREMTYFNSGVLLLNTFNMKEKCNQIFSDLRKGNPNKIGLLDQGYLNQYCFKDFELLPIEYNWKPYWGINTNAFIIHYHGVKPEGNYENSGFTMTEKTLLNIIKTNNGAIPGLIYYVSLYFEQLGLDGKSTLASFTSNLVRLCNNSLTMYNGHVSTAELKKIFTLYISEKVSKLVKEIIYSRPG